MNKINSEVRSGSDIYANVRGATLSPDQTKQGKLVVAGSGIKGVAQLTLETVGWIKNADVVAYCVSDPATEIWIKQNARSYKDLYCHYGNQRPRIETYNSMVEDLVGFAKAGYSVCGLFYGHPGLFVNPGHRAVAEARALGIDAEMLAGISAVDCLYSDVGFDPSTAGMQTFEATDMLLRGRKPDPANGVIVWQIGCVGDIGFNFNGFDNRNLGVLCDYLELIYPADHEVVLYEGTQYVVSKSRVERLALSQLRLARVTGISTLYLPPVTRPEIDRSMAEKLGLIRYVTKSAHTSEKTPSAVVASTSPTHGSNYQPVADISGLANFIIELSVNPSSLLAYQANPKRTSLINADLDKTERAALLSGHGGRIRMAIRAGSAAPAEETTRSLASVIDIARSNATGKNPSSASN